MNNCADYKDEEQGKASEILHVTDIYVIGVTESEKTV